MLGEVLEQIGGAYLGTGRSAFNASPLFHALVGGGLLRSIGETDVRATRATLESLEAARAGLERARPACADGELVRARAGQAIRLARHGAWRMLRAAGRRRAATAELRRIWPRRSTSSARAGSRAAGPADCATASRGSKPRSRATGNELSPRARAAREGSALAALLASNALQYACVVVAGFALQWLVMELTSSRTLLGAVAFAQGATAVALTPLAGVLADRRPRRGLIARARCALAAALLATAALIASGGIGLGSALTAAVIASALAAAIAPAVPAYIGELAAPGNLQRGIAIDTTGSALAQVLGPAAAGLLIPLAGVAAVYAGAGTGLVAAAALLLLVPLSERSPGSAAGSAWSSLRSAFAHVRAHPPLLLTLLGASLAVFNGALQVLRPVFARHVLEVGSQGFGWMAAAGGAGTLVASLAAAVLPPLRRYGVAITAAMLAYALCLVAYSYAFSLGYVLAIEFAAGVAGSLWTVWVISGFQLAVPEALRGRVLSLVLTLSNFGFVGYAPVGALADAIGDELAMRVFGLIPSAALLALLLFGYRTLRRM